MVTGAAPLATGRPRARRFRDVVGMAQTRADLAAAGGRDTKRVAELQTLLGAEAATAGDDVDTAPYNH